jgi:hypothetical protein
MPRAFVPAAVLALILPLFPVRADDGPAQVKKPQSGPESKAERKNNERPPISRERLRDILRDALKQIRTMDEAAAKSKGDLDPLSTVRLAMANPTGLQATTVATIGRAQAKVGDLPGARSTWQLAVDSAGEASFANSATEHGALYIEIAKAQVEAGELTEAINHRRRSRSLSGSPRPRPGSLILTAPTGRRANPIR